MGEVEKRVADEKNCIMSTRWKLEKAERFQPKVTKAFRILSDTVSVMCLLSLSNKCNSVPGP